ncbi:protein adenylyltransferase SelO [Litoreibacter arenae]|uniref:Protein nucleotidyltransferase YdiU n=1 Tax=Litoreibacter arenae DSM 19593 TaxID=1123360 RepID=S9QN64_9RHOB|nr:YdiU family protein [Litoreibacter arenae]EPX81043.1 Selenoprotein O and cysteine-containing protein [Litoreibacter arenae DSM 19593]
MEGKEMGSPEFDNSYARLPERFYTKMNPTPVAAPALIALNDALAGDMGLDAAWLRSSDGLAMLAGNRMPDGAEPLAQAYAGHQFGGWSPQLGDGRANVLGEVVGPDGARWDIQLKGSGPTPYSRMGDGRAGLGPVMREYIFSEAMHALSVPTTRALAAVLTGEKVAREVMQPGAILTRVAGSHIRVGTFQYFAARQDREALALLLDHAIGRHYPHLEQGDGLGFLQAVTGAQASLVAEWMGLGFIHGVMNTDNTHVGGLTIDYGPCAFMDAYHPATVFSSIDQGGRYVYQGQPEVLVWNLAQLASCLLPFIDADHDKAVTAAREALGAFGDHYTKSWKRVFFAKIGRAMGGDDQVVLVQDLLTRMADNQADFTRTFRAMARGEGARDEFVDPTSFDAWEAEWGGGDESIMRAANPAVIPRNHRVEEAIQAGMQGDYAPFHRLNEALVRPYDDREEFADLEAAPTEQQLVRQTFCGT